MKSFIKSVTITASVVAAALLLAQVPVASQSVATDDELTGDYPIILIHGLGEEPGDATFGNLVQLLEDFYYDVEVMDFDSYAGLNLAGNKNRGQLDVQAAVFGIKVRQTLTKYKAEKVNIIAHSYGGLIVHAYLLNLGAGYDKRGAFGDSVANVYYMQVPFYGATADDTYLAQLAADTDFGPYTDPDEIVKTLQVGSEWLYRLDTAMREDNPYYNVLTLMAVTKQDEVVPKILGTLVGSVDPYQPYLRYRTFNRYPHSNHELSQAESRERPLCYVSGLNDEVFTSIISYFDNGRAWRKIGSTSLLDAILLIKHDGSGLDEKSVILTLLKKKDLEANKDKTDDIAPPKKKVPVYGIFNSDSSVYTFTDLYPGLYEIQIKDGGKTIREQYAFGIRDQVNLAYTSKTQTIGLPGVEGFFNLLMTILRSDNSETASYNLPQLNTNGFEIRFELDEADMSKFNKGLILALYNANGTMDNPQLNGGLFEIVVRGDLYDPHRGRVQINIAIDENHDGHAWDEELDELKSGHTFNWRERHSFRIRVQTRKDGSCLVTAIVDGTEVFNSDYEAPYFNPAPVLSIGGRHHDPDEYQTPKDARISNLVISNIKK